MPSIADLFISVSSDVSGAITGLTAVDEAVNGTSASMASAVPAGLALAGAATAVGGAFLDSIGVAADFEQHISGIKAVLSPEEVNQFGGALEQLALTLGKDTVFSSDQAASAIEELVKAGVDVQTVLDGGASAALSLAAATGISVTQAANFAGTALNTFHESADQLNDTINTLAGVANASAADIGDLQFAFAAVGPVAASIGLSFDDTAIALGAFADNGLRGSDAGTSLKTMLLNLEPNTKASVAAMQSLGIVTADGANQFFDATGKAKSMSEIFQVLQTATSGLSDEQKIMALQTAFGTDAVRAATIAASEGAAGFDSLAANVAKISAADAAATRLDNLKGSLNQLGGSFETVQITIGTLFLPALRAIVDAATGVLNAFLNLDPTWQTLIVAAVGLAGAIAGIGAAFILLGPVLSSVGAGFGVLLAAIAPVSGILIAISVAVAALTAAWVTDFGGIQETTQSFVNAVIPVLQAGLNNLVSFWQGTLLPNIQQFGNVLGNEVAPAIGNFINGALATLSGALNNAAQFWTNTLAPAASAFANFLGNQVAPAIGDFINGALDTLNGALNAAGGFWTDVLSPAIQATIDFLQGPVAGAFGGFIDGALSTLQGAINFLADTWNGPLGTAIQGIITTLETDAITAFSNLAQFIQESVIPVFLQISGDVGAALIDFIQNQLPNALAELGRQAESLGPLLESVANFFGAINNLLGTLASVGLQIFADLLFQVVVPAIDALTQAIAPGNTAIADTANLFASVGQNLGTIGQGLQPVTDLFNAMASAINSVAAALQLLPEWFEQQILGGGTFNTVMLPGDTTNGPNDTGTLGGLSPLVSIGTLIISSEEDAVAFLQLVAGAVLASARRVTPPTAGGNPVLG